MAFMLMLRFSMTGVFIYKCESKHDEHHKTHQQNTKQSRLLAKW